MKTSCPLCNKTALLKYIVLSYRYYFCKFCITLFIHPLPTTKTLNTYYKKNFVYLAGATNEVVIRKRAKIILGKLMKLNPKGLTLLDIGSGYGYLLDEAQKNGLKVTGIEPSKTLVQQNKNLTFVVNDQFPSKKLINIRFDFITLTHVLEHVNNPEKFVNQVLSFLNPNGILYIETPNLDSHLYRFEKENYTFLTPPDHLWIFSQYSFLRMISNDYKIYSVSTYSYPEHFMGIVKSIFKQSRKSNIQTKTHCNNWSSQTKQNSPIKSIKYILFDLLIAKLFYSFLNLHQYGSVLELYINNR